MKTSMTGKTLALITLLAATLALPALAQSAPGAGNRPCAGNSTSAMGMGGGMGGGMHGGRGAANGTGQAPGWSLLTPEERSAQQARMRAVKTYDECIALRTEQRGMLEVRAKEKGVTLPLPRRNPCEVMKARGVIQ